MSALRIFLVFRLAVISGAIGVSILAAAGAFAPARAGAPVLVIAPPWSGGAAAVLAQAGGQEIAPVRAPFAVLGVLDRPEDVRQAGAWAVWDAAFLAQLCGVDPTHDRSIPNV